MEFGAYLKELRDKKGLTIVEVAEVSNLSHTYISMLEKGQRKPTKNAIDKISNGLGDTEEEKRSIKIMLENYSDEELKKLAHKLAKEQSDFVVDMVNRSGAIEVWEKRVEEEKYKLNLNLLFDFYQLNSDLEEVRKDSKEKYKNFINIELDNIELSNEEKISLELLLLGIREKRKNQKP